MLQIVLFHWPLFFLILRRGCSGTDLDAQNNNAQNPIVLKETLLMNKMLLFLAVCVSTSINAAPPVTHQFTNGTTIEASQVNANYQELADRIEVLQNQVLTLQNNSQKTLIGYTAAYSTNSYGEYVKLSNICYSEFIDSRICSSKEAIETINPPSLGNTDRAWVRPTSLKVTSSGGYYDSFSGLSGSYASPESSIRCMSIGLNPEMKLGCSDNFGLVQYKVACCK